MNVKFCEVPLDGKSMGDFCKRNGEAGSRNESPQSMFGVFSLLIFFLRSFGCHIYIPLFRPWYLGFFFFSSHPHPLRFCVGWFRYISTTSTIFVVATAAFVGLTSWLAVITTCFFILLYLVEHDCHRVFKELNGDDRE